MTARREVRMAWKRTGDGEIALPAPEHFRYGINLDYLASARKECMYRVTDGVVKRAVRMGSVLFVAETREAEGGGVAVRLRGAQPADADALAAAAALGAAWFDLDTDLAPFYAMAERDPLLGPVVDRFRGLRLLGIPDLYEALAWGIIGQQINLSFAHTLKRRFVEAYGAAVPDEDGTLWAFPEAETVAALRPDELGKLGISARKCEYLIEAARAIAERRLTKQALLEAGDPEEAGRMLTAIRGIGPWTAHYVLMRCLRLPSAFPIDDAGLHNAVKRITNRDAKPTRAELRELFAPWAGYEAYAVFYLWRLLY